MLRSLPNRLAQGEPLSSSGGLGRLGISDKCLGWALQVKWLWLPKTDPNKPWSMFSIQISGCIRSLFPLAVVGDDGTNMLFWKDRWLIGQQLRIYSLDALVPKRSAAKRTIL